MAQILSKCILKGEGGGEDIRCRIATSALKHVLHSVELHIAYQNRRIFHAKPHRGFTVEMISLDKSASWWTHFFGHFCDFSAGALYID